ncbi:MAG: DUF6799 domain-containing protein [Chthoniobacteraceae bacterium]
MKKNLSVFSIMAMAGLCYPAFAADEVTSPRITTNPALAGDGIQVGVSKRDGVTLSGGEAYVTRNGATEKLTKDLLLPSGVIARPDGTVLLSDKTEATLRATQLLTFEGKIVPLIPDPNVNPGDPRGNGSPAGTSAGSAGPMTAGSPTNPTGTSRSMLRDRPAGNGNVFLGSDGVPFMGTLNPDGTLTRADGTILRADGSFRAVTFGPDGAPTLGTVNSNGSITRADGSVTFPDGSVRAANGSVISGPTNGNAGMGVPQNNNGVTGGQNTNSPNNTGTFNNGNTNPGVPGATNNGTTQTNNGVTTGRSGSSNTTQGAGSSGSNSGSTRGTNGASGGAASGGGASGAGGAPGGSAGGASR